MAALRWKPPAIANLNQPRSSFRCGNNCLTCNYINYGLTKYIINSTSETRLIIALTATPKT